MKRFLLALVILIPFGMEAQGQQEVSYNKGDTLYFDSKQSIAPRDQAAYYGFVKHVNEEENSATVLIFSMKDDLLIEQRRCVASGENAGKKKGQQLYFNADRRVEESQVYTLVHNEKTGKTHSRLASETLLYPDGKVREEVTFSYPEDKGFEERSYSRKGYDENGRLLFEETSDKTSTIVYYDENGQPTDHPAQTVEPYMENPEFPGGQSELLHFLSQNVHYPHECQIKGIQGRVICRFVVAKDGKIEDVRVVRSGGHPLLDREALRVIRSMPKWKPGKQRGKPVRVQYTVPVNFRLE